MLDRNLAHLELILRLIDHIERRVANVTVDDFAADQDELDLTSFRLSIIGESATKLSPELKERHPSIPWRAMIAMRNVIAHNYDGVFPEEVWNAAKNLGPLARVCRDEVERARDAE